MQVYNLKDFKRGWIVGNFFPSLFRCDKEVGIQYYKSGEKHDAHYHARGTEINTVIFGSCLFKTYDIISKEEQVQKLNTNQSISISPYVVTIFEALSDCCLVVVKTISDTNDKYIVNLELDWKSDLLKIIPPIKFPEVKLIKNLPFTDLSNQDIGDLFVSTLNKVVISSGRKRRYWLCICKCGKLNWILGETLQRIKQKGWETRCRECNLRLPNFEGPRKYIFRDYKVAAKKRNLEFTLTYDEFISLIDMRCVYCGSLPKNSYTRHTEIPFIYQGIDRIDNKIGYIKENCVPCCHQCNWSKGTMSKTDFLEWIRMVYTFGIKEK